MKTQPHFEKKEKTKIIYIAKFQVKIWGAYHVNV